jgi:tubulin polyglutamylase TTLL6/13
MRDRFCTEKYKAPKASNLDVAFMHLTNYAVNKKNEAFVQAQAAGGGGGGDEGEGDREDASKWTLAQLQAHLTAQGGWVAGWWCAPL